jgi:hypothetical protein
VSARRAASSATRACRRCRRDRTVAQKTVAGQTGLRLSAGATLDEIDIGETCNISYGVSETIDTMRVLLRFYGPEFNDVAEVVRVTVNGGAGYTLSVSGTVDNVASWSGAGSSVVSCGATTAAGSGGFDIRNPFGGPLVNALYFPAITGGTPFGGSGTNPSDYALGSIRGAHAVPEPATILPQASSVWVRCGAVAPSDRTGIPTKPPASLLFSGTESRCLARPFRAAPT